MQTHLIPPMKSFYCGRYYCISAVIQPPRSPFYHSLWGLWLSVGFAVNCLRTLFKSTRIKLNRFYGDLMEEEVRGYSGASGRGVVGTVQWSFGSWYKVSWEYIHTFFTFYFTQVSVLFTQVCQCSQPLCVNIYVTVSWELEAFPIPAAEIIQPFRCS